MVAIHAAWMLLKSGTIDVVHIGVLGVAFCVAADLLRRMIRC